MNRIEDRLFPPIFIIFNAVIVNRKIPELQSDTALVLSPQNDAAPGPHN
jgi:hypothetical protein